MVKFLASLGLVLGGLLLALSLLGVLGGLAAAAGMLGGATLLAALGYSALKTGSLLHGAALLAPVGPMLAFALDPSHQGEEQDGATRVLLVAAAVVGLYVLANLPWPLRSPLASVAAGWSRLRADWRDRPRVRRQVMRAGLLLTLVVVVGLALSGLDAAGRIDLAGAATWVVETARLLTGGAVAGVFVGVLVVGAALAWREGGMLRSWRPVVRKADTGAAVQMVPVATTYGTAGAAQGTFTLLNVAQPAGVAAAWAPAYGAGFLLLAWVSFISGWTESAGTERWQQFSFWWLGAVGVVLCLLAPVVVTRRTRRSVTAALARLWSPETEPGAGPAPDVHPLDPRDDEQRLIFALLKNDTSYYYLLAARGGSRLPRLLVRPLLRPHQATTLVLSRRGGPASRAAPRDGAHLLRGVGPAPGASPRPAGPGNHARCVVAGPGCAAVEPHLTSTVSFRETPRRSTSAVPPRGWNTTRTFFTPGRRGGRVRVRSPPARGSMARRNDVPP